MKNLKSYYENSKEIYAEIGIDTDKVIKELKEIPISIHCWQGDDVSGFENPGGALTGGIQATGNYFGKAQTIGQLRADFEKAMAMIPGRKRISLHAIYLDNMGEKVERNSFEPRHFDSWIDWAKANDLGIDFNPTFFSHPMSADGFTLSHPSETVRQYWIEHGIATRKAAEYIGKKLNNKVYTNFWMPDGYKDIPVDRYSIRARLADSLDKIFAVDIDENYNADSLESKLFGVGAESCTIGSHEFFMGYAVKNDKFITLDTGHFHPSEFVSDKISSLLLFVRDILLHVSRPVRWDSDHVVILDDELKNIALEIVRKNFENRVHIGLDYFDASINRIAAWVIGTRNMQKALLYAKLEPTEMLSKMEFDGDYTSRLALLEEYKTYPFSAVWDMYCEECNVPVRDKWLEEVKSYEKNVLALR